jgi:hypothetical protein
VEVFYLSVPLFMFLQNVFYFLFIKYLILDMEFYIFLIYNRNFFSKFIYNLYFS